MTLISRNKLPLLINGIAGAIRMAKEISEKSTKGEILKAYEEIMAKYEDSAAKAADKKAEVKATADKAVLSKASSYTVDSIVKESAELKLKIGKTLTELAEQLTEEADKLSETEQAIAIETKNLENIHSIEVDCLVKSQKA